MKKIDNTHWKEFCLGDFFDAERGSVKKLQALEEGTTPVIAAARNKQGVAGYYNTSSDYCDKITISCNGVGCGSTFYHDYPFNVNGDALVLIEKQKMSREVKLYLTCLFDSHFSRKYSYAEKCSPDKALNERIKLPTTPSGDPDWYYMEMYMRGVEAIVKNKLSLLVPHNLGVAIKDAANVTFNNANVTYIDNSKNYNIEK